MDINKIESKKALIFDVDGTLYSQPQMRFKMATRLLKFYITHFYKIKELYLLYMFRRLREDESYQKSSLDEQIRSAAEKSGLEYTHAKETVDKWMFKSPLEIIKQTSFSSLLSNIKRWKSEDKAIIIYSDYPADEKIDALNLEVSAIFTPETPGIDELKPSKKAMSSILSTISCSTEDVLYVGDRFEKDGKSAEFAGIDYCDIKDFLKLIN